MARTSIADILALLGGPGLDDSTAEGRIRFRNFVCQSKWSPDDLRGWIDECMEMASRARAEYYFALQDLVTSIGTQLGFEVEFGCYTSQGADIPYDGRWRTLTGEDILIEVKSSPWPLGSASQLGQYMDQYAATLGPGPHPVFGLYAIGTGDFSGLIDQIKGSEYRNRLKVVSFHDLLRLFTLRTLLGEQMPLDRLYQVIQDLLLPFESVNVGSIVDIIEGLAAASLGGSEPLDAEEPAIRPRQWRRSELREFLEGCQPHQTAMLLALCSSPHCELSGDDLVRRMRAFAPGVPGLDETQPFTAKTIGGARSGLSKREQQMGKDSVVESFNGRYYIREEYREWVAEWLRLRGLMPDTCEVPDDEQTLFAADTANAAG